MDGSTKEIHFFAQKKKRGIKISDFFLLFFYHNLLCLPEAEQNQVVKRFDLLSKEAIKILEYRKNNYSY